MERYAWTGRIREGMYDEYVRRHSQLWPEMEAVLREAGIRNYSIWTDGQVLFGYYECEGGRDIAARIQAESPVVARWNRSMEGVMEMEMDPRTGAQPLLQEVFYLP